MNAGQNTVYPYGQLGYCQCSCPYCHRPYSQPWQWWPYSGPFWYSANVNQQMTNAGDIAQMQGVAAQQANSNQASQISGQASHVCGQMYYKN